MVAGGAWKGGHRAATRRRGRELPCRGISPGRGVSTRGVWWESPRAPCPGDGEWVCSCGCDGGSDDEGGVATGPSAMGTGCHGGIPGELVCGGMPGGGHTDGVPVSKLPPPSSFLSCATVRAISISFLLEFGVQRDNLVWDDFIPV